VSKQPNPTLIGSFVLGGTALLVAAVLIIASDAWFSDRLRYVIYFDGSINGLAVGSSVVFRGVPVGYVTDVEVLADYSTMEFSVPVYVDINRDVIKRVDEGSRDPDRIMEELIENGLRASLETGSFITGQLIVDLDFHPGTQPRYKGRDNTVPEIPSIATGIQAVIKSTAELMEQIQSEVDIVTIVRDVASTIAGLDELVNSGDLRAALAGANNLINARQTQQVPAELNQTLAELRQAIGAVDAVAGELSTNLPDIAASLNATLAQATDVLALAERSIGEDSDLSYRVSGALREIESAARSVRILTEYLEQNPNALLTGKPPADN
jgi:paraquat-inducible protein B